ncbi:hypothetical protein JCM17845_18470 [Iodidimonas gelatinilytica]|uniref:Uncharacterized protein n=1 Tax=Iodidimonas gelatinilytica TaxID=1236966 RepID=A0A5A7N0P1_9PROT|nr:hypothetical protein JCM17845_18470 [Iodidimonas gelatinilytica]
MWLLNSLGIEENRPRTDGDRPLCRRRSVRNLAILAQAVMPDSMEKLLDQLGIDSRDRGFDQLGERGRLKPGIPLPSFGGVPTLG